MSFKKEFDELSLAKGRIKAQKHIQLLATFRDIYCHTLGDFRFLSG
jgi:hypothetical protein